MAPEKTMEEILRQASTVAVVGLSADESKDSNKVARYLMLNGYRVIPVNPKHTEILGLTCYPDLENIPEDQTVDIVDVFRPGEVTPSIAESAVRIKADCLWLQLGITSRESERIARRGGLAFVQDHCMKIEHRKLFR